MNREFTDEGNQMSDNITRYYNLMNGGLPTQIADDTNNDEPKTRKGKAEKELEFLKTEIAKMIANSLMVVQDCDNILADVKDMEEYMMCDAKVAKTIHTRVIERLSRIFGGLPAFEVEPKILIEETNRVLVAIASNKNIGG